MCTTHSHRPVLSISCLFFAVTAELQYGGCSLIDITAGKALSAVHKQALLEARATDHAQFVVTLLNEMVRVGHVLTCHGRQMVLALRLLHGETAAGYRAEHMYYVALSR
jgi:hypothetical protein